MELPFVSVLRTFRLVCLLHCQSLTCMASQTNDSPTQHSLSSLALNVVHWEQVWDMMYPPCACSTMEMYSVLVAVRIISLVQVEATV